MRNLTAKLAATAVAAAVLAFTPVVSRAYVCNDGPDHQGAGKHWRKMAAELGLSPQQKQDIKEIIKKNRPQAEPLMKQHLAERRALRDLIQAETTDEAAIRTQAAKVAAIEADLAVQRAHTGQEIRKVLTPEQVQKFKELQARRDRKMDKFRNRAGKRLDQVQ